MKVAMTVTATVSVCSDYVMTKLLFQVTATQWLMSRWPNGKASASREEDPGFESHLHWDRVIPVTQKLALQWLFCQAPGVIGSALGLVGPVSVHCDWVRWKVWSATSVSVWQHVKLSKQIRPWDTLACCWDVKQPTNKHIVTVNVVCFFEIKTEKDKLC